MTMLLPRDNLVRAFAPGFELRASADGGMPTLVGNFAVFNEWTEINSMWEGNFLERIDPAAFKKTVRENRASMRVLFQHGRDPVVGDKPLGPIAKLDAKAAYEVPLLDTTYNADLIPGLEAGLYGASFRFQVMKEELVEEPAASDYNPRGLPERTIKEARVFEFGPVTFPAYASATAGVRSLTDEFMLSRTDPERLRATAEFFEKQHKEIVAPRHLDADGEFDSTTREALEDPDDALADEEPTEVTPEDASRSAETEAAEREQAVPTETKDKHVAFEHGTVAEMAARQTEIKAEQTSIYAEYGGEVLSVATQGTWDALDSEYDELTACIASDEKMRARLATLGEAHVDGEAPPIVRGRQTNADPYDVTQYRDMDPDRAASKLRDGALRSIESSRFPEGVNKERAQTHVAQLLDTTETKDGALARRILLTGSPVYKRAFGKLISGAPLSAEEQRAMSLTLGEGGYAVPYTLDPTVILTSEGAVNPLRAISRVETIVTDVWKGVASAGVTASYAAEASEVGDDSPTFTQPEVNAEKAHAFIPFSMEIGGDFAGLQGELVRMLAEGKDDLEAVKFVTGLGHALLEPEGILTGATTTVSTAVAHVFSAGDLQALVAALPERYEPRARFVAHRGFYQLVRNLDTTGGAQFWVDLGGAVPPQLMGYPVSKASAISSNLLTDDALIAVYGDFSRFLIVDRIGMAVELIPNLMGPNRRPTGQRGFYAWWRNSSDVLVPDAFRVLKVKGI